MKNEVITLSHGSGGKAMAELIDSLFMKAFDNPYLNERNDQATFDAPKGKMVITTDSFVISPIFFPGGDIGSLAVHGTVNDVAMGGAKPLYMTAACILEEGFPIKDLEKIILSMAKAAKEAGVQIVTGDTKVVEKGKGDGIFINTTAVGVVYDKVQVSVRNVRVGDKILVSGFIGDHGVAIMSKRANLSFDTNILSDSAALHDLVAKMVQKVPKIHCMRDPTRGGIAATLNEIADQSKSGVVIDEKKIPVREAVQSACELLGLDPLYVANEGKLLAFCPANEAEKLLEVMKAHPLGKDSAIIGEVVDDKNHFVVMNTLMGGKRVVHWLSGEQLPRIC